MLGRDLLSLDIFAHPFTGFGGVVPRLIDNPIGRCGRKTPERIEIRLVRSIDFLQADLQLGQCIHIQMTARGKPAELFQG